MFVDLKKKRVDYPSIMNFDGQSGLGSQEICDLFVFFMERTYADEKWVPSDPRSFHFTFLKVLKALLDYYIDSYKGPGPDSVPPDDSES
jgi:hypothetical protein